MNTYAMDDSEEEVILNYIFKKKNYSNFNNNQQGFFGEE